MKNAKSTKFNPKKDEETKEVQRRKGKSYSSKKNGAARSETSSSSGGGATNLRAPSWLSGNSDLLRYAANTSFNYPTGLPVKSLENIDLVDGEYKPIPFPGIMVLRTTLTPGYCQEAYDALNVASQRMYSFIRSANSGSKNYEAPDLMMYIMAIAETHAMLGFYTRIASVLQSFSIKNRYYGIALLRSMGMTEECAVELFKEQANFKAWLGTMVSRINAFAIPYIPIVEEWVNEWKFIYKDSENEKAQWYMFTPYYYHVFDAYSDVNGGFLRAVEWEENNITSVAVLENVFDTMVNLLSNNEDIGTMSGDIVKAFGNDLMVAKGFEGETEYAIIDPLKLVEIDNATIMGDEVAVEIRQKGGFLYTPVTMNYDGVTINDETWVFKQTDGSTYSSEDDGLYATRFYYPSAYEYGMLLSLPVDDPAPEHVALGTRYMANLGLQTLAIEGSKVPQYVPDAEAVSGFAIVSRIDPEQVVFQMSYINEVIMWYATDKFVKVSSPALIQLDTLNETTRANFGVSDLLPLVSRYSHFSRHPRVVVLTDHKLADGTAWNQLATNVPNPVGLTASTTLIWDIQNYTVISVDKLRSMNDTLAMLIFGF